jgi:DNA-binding response OmpR family regulator
MVKVNQREAGILIVDDELESDIIKAVRRKLEAEDWTTSAVEPEGPTRWGDDFELAALYAVETEQPEAVLLDVRFGDHKDDRFKGLSILHKIVERYPKLPVLMFTQYAQGADRVTAASGSLKWDAPVDFIDKLASPEEVVLRLRRLIGRSPQMINIGRTLCVDTKSEAVFVIIGETANLVDDITGTKYKILRELATAWYRSPGELVPFARLERYLSGEDARASIRVRIREIKDTLGKAMGHHFAADDFIVNVRNQGYRIVATNL